MNELIPLGDITAKIRLIRAHHVILDQDIATLYGVETRVLVQAVQRNITRFPGDFMFQLSNPEMECLRSQIVISKRGGRRYLPYAFTEQGIAMLSSVLHSERAIQVNIALMRVFVLMRKSIGESRHLLAKIEAMEHKYDSQFGIVFEAIKRLIRMPAPPDNHFGFRKE